MMAVPASCWAEATDKTLGMSREGGATNELKYRTHLVCPSSTLQHGFILDHNTETQRDVWRHSRSDRAETGSMSEASHSQHNSSSSISSLSDSSAWHQSCPTWWNEHSPDPILSSHSELMACSYMLSYLEGLAFLITLIFFLFSSWFSLPIKTPQNCWSLLSLSAESLIDPACHCPSAC